MFWFWVFFFSFILAKTATVEDGKSSYQKKKKQTQQLATMWKWQKLSDLD